MTSTILTIDSSQQLIEHIDKLIEIEPRFAPLHQQVGIPNLRRNEGGFSELMRSIVGQQVSVASADSVWSRLLASDLTNPAAVIAADATTLKANGLSRQKIRYVKSLAARDIDFAGLKQLPDEAVIDILTDVVGIGRWTAEMYLLFSLGRADVLAVDDIAVKEEAKQLLELEARPTPKQLQTLSQRWSPYRTAANLLFWEHYIWARTKATQPSAQT